MRSRSAVLALFVLAGCGDGASEARLHSEVYRIRDATIASSGKLAEASEIKRSDRGVVCSWSVSTDLDWAAYKGDLEKRLAPKYHVLTSTDSELGFSWTGDGDTYSIMIRLVSPQKPRSLRVQFTASAS